MLTHAPPALFLLEEVRSAHSLRAVGSKSGDSGRPGLTTGFSAHTTQAIHTRGTSPRFPETSDSPQGKPCVPSSDRAAKLAVGLVIIACRRATTLPLKHKPGFSDGRRPPLVDFTSTDGEPSALSATHALSTTAVHCATEQARRRWCSPDLTVPLRELGVRRPLQRSGRCRRVAGERCHRSILAFRPFSHVHGRLAVSDHDAVVRTTRRIAPREPSPATCLSAGVDAQNRHREQARDAS